jgi:hypothetical protein
MWFDFGKIGHEAATAKMWARCELAERHGWHTDYQFVRFLLLPIHPFADSPFKLRA